MNSTIEQQINKRDGVKAWLTLQQNKSLLRFLTCGSVDDGKSTLIGRILYDSQQIYEDQLSSLCHDSKRYGTQNKKLDLALLVDGLQAEREQGITIDVAYRYFSTEKCKFIIADTPGHEQYTRNMATGASTSDLCVLLVDARKGLLLQTRRHSFISTLLGIKNLVVAINKMDLIDYKQNVYEQIKHDYLDFATQLKINLDIQFVPISALEGDNVVRSSQNMMWYKGRTLLNLLENIKLQPVETNQSMRFPIQYIINRPNINFRGYAGKLASGTLKLGQCIKILPSNIKSNISRIVTFDGDLQEAYVGENITIVLKDEIDISRGDILIDATENFKMVRSAIIDVIWMADKPLQKGQKYEIKIASKKTYCYIEKIIHQIDINTLETKISDSLLLNSIGLVEITFEDLMALDHYNNNRVTGGMIFIDLISNLTVGIGMINRFPIKINTQEKNHYDDFELELNALIRRHFPYWNARNLVDDK